MMKIKENQRVAHFQTSPSDTHLHRRRFCNQAVSSKETEGMKQEVRMTATQIPCTRAFLFMVLFCFLLFSRCIEIIIDL